jgi:hypothetical protein
VVTHGSSRITGSLSTIHGNIRCRIALCIELEFKKVLPIYSVLEDRLNRQGDFTCRWQKTDETLNCADSREGSDFLNFGYRVAATVSAVEKLLRKLEKCQSAPNLSGWVRKQWR